MDDERCQPDGEDASDERGVKAHCRFREMDVVFFADEVCQYPNHADELRDNGGGGGSADSPMENEEKKRRQNQVAADGHQHRNHCLCRIAGGSHDAVEPEKDVGDGIANEDNLDEVAGIGNGFLVGPEQIENGVEEDEGEYGKENADYNV